MKKINISIRKPDDGAGYYETYVKSDLLKYERSKTVAPDRSAKDPLHSALKDMFKKILKQPRVNRWGYTHKVNYFGEEDFNGVFWIKECPIALSRVNNRYRINGKAESMETIANAFARELRSSLVLLMIILS